MQTGLGKRLPGRTEGFLAWTSRLCRPGGEEEGGESRPHIQPMPSPGATQMFQGPAQEVRGWELLAPSDSGLSAGRTGGHFKPLLIAI